MELQSPRRTPGEAAETPGRAEQPQVVLVQPPVRDFYLTAKRTVPYGLASIAGSLRAAGFGVSILDALATDRRRVAPLPEEMAHLRACYGRADRSPFALFHHYREFGLEPQRVAEEVAASGAFLVGISALFSAYADEAARVARAIRERLPRVAIVVGGHHPTALPARVMEEPAVDFVLRGDGEVSLPVLARALLAQSGLEQVPGLVRREAGRLVVGQPAYAPDLDRLPAPAADLVDRFYRGRATIVASRGCPLACSYCSVGARSGMPHRRRSVASVLAELARAVEEQGATFVDFEDENLSLDRGWFLSLLAEVARRFAGRGPELRAMNGLLPHTLDGEVVAAMRGAGFRTLNLSLGSSDAAQQRRFQRPAERMAFDRALAAAERQGLQAVGYVVVGAPGQDPRASVADLLFLARRRVLCGVSVYYPAPGSADYERCAASGLLPQALSLLRSSALPIADRTSREQAATLLRLGRLLNFAKSLIDEGSGRADGRRRSGVQLLQLFLGDGAIRGLDRDGSLYEHPVDRQLALAFRDGLLAGGPLRGVVR